MRTANLIKTKESTVYKNKNGEIINPTPEEKLFYLICKPEFCINKTEEEVVDCWKYKTKKEIEKRFWDYMKENNLNSRDYNLVFID